jgi:hypothetical protein
MQASHPSFFNPHTHHVSANLLFQLARIEGKVGRDAVSLSSLAESLRRIEDTLQLIGAAGREKRGFADSIQMMTNLQRQILDSVTDIGEVQRYASEVFEASRCQTGFEVVGRKMLSEAGRSKKGTDYKRADDYVSDCSSLIEAQGQEPSPDMLALRVDVLVRWRIQQTRGQVDWEQLRNWLETISGDVRYRDDILKSYYFALSLFHTGDYPKAKAVFEALKRRSPSPRIRRGLRNCLLGKEGAPRRLQGTVRKAHSRTYVYCGEIDTDLEAFGGLADENEGATVHCYVAFSLSGPFAVKDRPTDSDTLLP